MSIARVIQSIVSRSNGKSDSVILPLLRLGSGHRLVRKSHTLVVPLMLRRSLVILPRMQHAGATEYYET